MAVKLLYYFIFSFVAILAFLLYQKPYNIDKNIASGKEANIEAIDVINYSINKDGVTSKVISSRVLRYTSYDEFFNVDATRKKEDNTFDNLKADKGTLIKNDLTFTGNVRYEDTTGVKFSSDKAQYNLQTKVFKANDAFVLENNSTITHGNSLVYQTKDGKIYAKNIRSQTEVKNK